MYSCTARTHSRGHTRVGCCFVSLVWWPFTQPIPHPYAVALKQWCHKAYDADNLDIVGIRVPQILPHCAGPGRVRMHCEVGEAMRTQATLSYHAGSLKHGGPQDSKQKTEMHVFLLYIVIVRGKKFAYPFCCRAIPRAPTSPQSGGWVRTGVAEPHVN